MLRRLIIATGTLGLILVGFGLYRSRNTVPEKPLPSLPVVTVAATSAPASQETATWTKGLNISPGKGASFEVFDQKGQLQYLMKAAEWKATSENELDLQKPELWKFMRSGQVLRITADSGQISVEQVGGNNPKPKRGWLRRNVRISIDLSAKAWRDAHPARAAIEQHPEHVITIDMDSLYFDDDLSLIRTDEAVRVRSSRFDIASTGLKMIYSRPMDRLEHLVLAKNGTIELRGDLALDRQSAGPASAVRPAATQARAQAPASRATSTASAPATQPEPQKFQDIYKAVFEGPIEVQQYRQDKLAARLDSDKSLEMLFDMTQKQRRANEEPERPLPGLESAPRTADLDDSERTVLTWAGSLEITPLERRPMEEAIRTARIMARGDNVTLEDVETGNTITCQQLDYDIVQRSGRVAAEAPAMARLVDNRGGYLAGQDIRFDQTERTLRIDGPGEAAEPEPAGAAAATATPSADGASRIRWTESLLVRFQPAEMPMPVSVIPLHMPTNSALMERLDRQSIFQMQAPARRSASLAGNPLQGLTATSAVIAGDAMVQRGTDTLRAGKLAIDFFPAVKGRTFGAIQAATGKDNVELLSKDQVIKADSLDVRFVLTEDGRSVPNHAIAQGHAAARQDTAEIAADFLDAKLAQVPVETQAGQATGKARPAVVVVTATGNVRIRDPQQEMDLRGDALTAEIPDGRHVKDLTIKGTPDTPASVVMRDYSLAGPTIQANLQSQDVVLPSAGHLELPVRQGPEGTRLTEPRKLTIKWTDRMQMWGSRNQAIFEGGVAATMDSRGTSGKDTAAAAGTETSSDDTAVTADRMTVFFRAVAAANASQPAAEPTAAVQVMEKAREQIAQVMPAAAEWLPSPRQGSKAPRLGNDITMQREPVRVIAEGHAKAISSRYEASHTILTSRLLIDGPTFEADLTRQELQVPGAGKLLLENYALVKTAAKLLAAGVNLATQPIEKAPEDSLSQTVFAWTNGMTFSLEDQLAFFDGGVNMVHRSGGKVVLGVQLSQALGASASLIQGMPGSIATLSSDNLVVQFSQTANRKAREEAARDQWLRRAELENMIATGNVYMNQELSNGGSRFLTAGRVQYSGQRETFVLQGTPGQQGSRGVPAKLVRQKDAQSAPEATTLDAFWWNVRTDEVSAKGIRGQGIQ